MNYKPGDKVKIIKDTVTHKIRIGSIQEIQRSKHFKHQNFIIYKIKNQENLLCARDIEPYKTNQNGNIINKGKIFNFK